VGAEEWCVSDYEDEPGEPALRIWRLAEGAFYYLRYLDGTEFVMDRSASQVWAAWPDTATIEDTAPYLLGPVLGIVLRLRGVTCLHASAVAVDGQAIVLMGDAGVGKSSTAAAFARLGYPVLSDDIVALTESAHAFLAQPGYPRLCLWPQSVAALYGTPDALPCIAPPWEKRYLDLTQDGYRFQREPLPVGAIYVLGERSTDPVAPSCRAMGGQEGLMALVGNTYANRLPDPAMRAREFQTLGRLVEQVPLRHVTPHEDFPRLLDLCRAVVEDFRALAGGPVADREHATLA
jgi:hypothetical protein